MRRSPIPGPAVLLAALLVLLRSQRAGAGAPAAAAESPSLSVRAGADTLAPDQAGLWQMEIAFHNPLEVGVYLDSLILHARDGDPGVTGLERVTRMDMTRLAAAFLPISAGDSTRFTFTPIATFERGELRFDWYAHTASHAPVHCGASLPTKGGALSDAHPSRLLSVGGRSVEIVEFPQAGTTKATGVLLVHGPGGHARGQLQMAARLAGLGLGVVLVSQPGYGRSDGPPDFVGPSTVAALEAALGALRKLPGVDGNRLAVWGVSRGATAALLLAERQPAGLQAVVAQGGLYDLAELAAAASVKASVLLIHGRGDEAAPIAQARALAGAMRAGGARVDTLFLPGGQLLPRGAVARAAIDFLSRLSTH
jgi:dienelactone hydrolase